MDYHHCYQNMAITPWLSVFKTDASFSVVSQVGLYPGNFSLSQ